MQNIRRILIAMALFCTVALLFTIVIIYKINPTNNTASIESNPIKEQCLTLLENNLIGLWEFPNFGGDSILVLNLQSNNKFKLLGFGELGDSEIGTWYLNKDNLSIVLDFFNKDNSVLDLVFSQNLSQDYPDIIHYSLTPKTLEIKINYNDLSDNEDIKTCRKADRFYINLFNNYLYKMGN